MVHVVSIVLGIALKVATLDGRRFEHGGPWRLRLRAYRRTPGSQPSLMNTRHLSLALLLGCATHW